MKKINILLNVSPSFVPKAKYVFETLFRVQGLKPTFFTEFTMENIHIFYGKDAKIKYPLHIYHNPEAAEFFNQRHLYPTNKVNLVKFASEYVPFLFSQPGEIFHNTAQSIYLRKDIIASAFYFLTCWQEYAATKPIDPNNFFKFQDSLQYSLGFAEMPVVDRYLEILRFALIKQFSDYSCEHIWGKKKYALSFSHNIDFWQYWTDEQIKLLKKRQDKIFSYKFMHKILRLFVYRSGIKIFEPNEIMQKILSFEKSNNINPSCFLLTNNSFPDKRMNYFSEVDAQAQILRALKNSSINLLGTKEAGYQLDFLEKEFEKIEELEIEGFRVRYLNFNYQNLFKALEKCGFIYDSSIGFYENIGFRAGISYPFFPYNIAEDRPFEVMELPIAITDIALYKQTNGNINRAKSKMENMLKKAAKHQTHISIVWHNHIFDKIDYPGWSNLYWKIAKFDRKHERMLFSTNELAKYWKERCSI
jgi:hypothetical protein